MNGAEHGVESKTHSSPSMKLRCSPESGVVTPPSLLPIGIPTSKTPNRLSANTTRTALRPARKYGLWN